MRVFRRGERPLPELRRLSEISVIGLGGYIFIDGIAYDLRPNFLGSVAWRKSINRSSKHPTHWMASQSTTVGSLIGYQSKVQRRFPFGR